MHTYETVVSILLGSIERTNLNVAYTQELLDTHALGRSLSITCLPDGMEDDLGPTEPPLRAVISFRWSPEFTVYSLRGRDTLENIERIVDERLYAYGGGPSLDIDVAFHIPLTNDQQRDPSALNTLAHTIQDLHRDMVEPEDLLRVESQVTVFPGRPPRMVNVIAHRTWSLNEALFDTELLAATFDEMCMELQLLLAELSRTFTTERDREDNSGPDTYGDRRYFKPPTA